MVWVIGGQRDPDDAVAVRNFYEDEVSFNLSSWDNERDCRAVGCRYVDDKLILKHAGLDLLALQACSVHARVPSWVVRKDSAPARHGRDYN